MSGIPEQRPPHPETYGAGLGHVTPGECPVVLGRGGRPEGRQEEKERMREGQRGEEGREEGKVERRRKEKEERRKVGERKMGRWRGFNLTVNSYPTVAAMICTHLFTDSLSYGRKSGCSVHIFAVHHVRGVHQYCGLPKDELIQNMLLQQWEVIGHILTLFCSQGVVAVGEDDGG